MSWQSVKLEDIFEIARGGSPRPIDDFITEEADGLNWISIKDASNSGKYISKTKLKIRKEGLFKSRLVQSGDFLLTNSMSFGRPYIMNTTGCIHDGWLVLSGDKSRVNQDYFYHLLGSDLLHKKFSSLAAGAVVKNLNINLVKNVEVPLPPLAEQQKIAAILDAVDNLRQKDQQLVERYTALSQSLFLEMFGDLKTNSKDWVFATVGDFFEVKGGKRLPKGSEYEKSPTQHAYIRVTDFEPNGLNTSNLKYISTDIHNKIKRYIIESNDVYISIAGTIGIAGFIPDKLSGANLTENAAKLVAKNKGSFNKEFLSYYLNSDFSQQHIKSKTMAVGVPKLALFRIEELPLITPSITMQNQFAERIQLIEAQKQQAQLSLEKSEALFNSLLQRAFTGELTAKMAA